MIVDLTKLYLNKNEYYVLNLYITYVCCKCLRHLWFT